MLELCQRADVVFLGLHGRDGEDGRVQAALELLGVPYTGSGYLASGVAMDKAVAKRIMNAEGIPTPKWGVLEYGPEDACRLAWELPMPCVVKCTTGGSSLGVFLPEDREEQREAVARTILEALPEWFGLPESREELRDALMQVRSFGGEVIWEERIYGRELTVAVLGDRALPAVETTPAGKDFDYAAKYQKGGAEEVCPAPLTEAEAAAAGELALRVHRALGQLWCLEANSLPGMTPTSFVPQEAAAVGLCYGELCEEIVRLSLGIRRR